MGGQGQDVRYEGTLVKVQDDVNELRDGLGEVKEKKKRNRNTKKCQSGLY